MSQGRRLLSLRIPGFFKAELGVTSEEERRQQRIREYRQEASRLASMANKRIARLEKNDLRDSPAYKRYIKDGGQRFGVKGKTYQEVQREVARLERFLNAKTSTVRGYHSTLKNLAEITNITFKNMNELRKRAAKFFELASRMEQYIQNVEGMGAAVGYQEIWTAIDTYTRVEGIDLLEADDKIEAMIDVLKKKHHEENRKVKKLWYKISKD